MSKTACSSNTRTLPFLPLLLLLLLLHVSTGYVAIASTSSDSPLSTSGSDTASANHRSARSTVSAEPVISGDDDEDDLDDDEKEGCSSDFVEKFFRLLSGPIGKEGEALVAAVVKLLSENDRVNWPAMATDWPSRVATTASATTLSRDVLPTAAKLRQIFLNSARRVIGRRSEKRMAPKFNPTGWRRKRSTRELDYPLLRSLLAKYEPTRAAFLGEDVVAKIPEDYAPAAAAKIAAEELLDEDNVNKLLSEISPEWPAALSKRSRSLARDRVVSRRRLSEGLPKRKPLEFNPTGW